MEMHQLRYVVGVSRTGSFSRAAQQCNVSQPALSQQIAKLEDELGERLFERTKREVRLTPHGEIFLQRALRVLAEVDGARRDASEAKNLTGGTIRLGVLPTIAPYFLPKVIMAFARKFPGIEVVVQEDTTAHLVQQVLALEIDFAVASRPLDDDRLELRDLFREELLLAVPPSHALARRKTVSVTDVAAEPFIVMKEGHCLGDQVLRFCERREVRAKISFRSAQLETIQALVTAGLGMSLVPAMAVRRTGGSPPAYRSVGPARPERVITALWPKPRGLSRAAGALLDLMAAQGAPS
jgi:LysR family hydrogen peroxide-inducible transcriptional activator